MFFAMSLIPLGDSFGKLLVTQNDASPIFVAWSRFFIGALVLLPFLSARHLDFALYRDWRIWLRAGFLTCGVSSIQVALATEPLPNVIGAFFIGPIISYFLSALFLREVITWARTGLLCIGFFGILLVVKPGFGMTSGIGFAMLAGVFYGCFLTASRWLSHIAVPRAILFSQLIIPAILLTPFGAAQIPQITWEVSALTLGSAVASMVGNLLLVIAYKRAPASQLAPFVYFQIFAATLYGYTMFGQVSDFVSGLGLLILMVSGFASLALRR
jgi:drug/metabolite transporter (DMT)-like permease